MNTSEKSLPKKLKELGFNCYSDYLKSKHWISFRKRFYGNFYKTPKGKRMYARFKHLVCEFCEQKNQQLNVHHSTYKRLGKERIQDVRLLCEDCHLLVHALPRDNNHGHLRGRTNKVNIIIKNNIKREEKNKKNNIIKEKKWCFNKKEKIWGLW